MFILVAGRTRWKLCLQCFLSGSKFLPSCRACSRLGKQGWQGLPGAGQLERWQGAQGQGGCGGRPQRAVLDRMPAPSRGGTPFLAESTHQVPREELTSQLREGLMTGGSEMEAAIYLTRQALQVPND